MITKFTVTLLNFSELVLAAVQAVTFYSQALSLPHQ
jgi:hypothetical protein